MTVANAQPCGLAEEGQCNNALLLLGLCCTPHVAKLLFNPCALWGSLRTRAVVLGHTFQARPVAGVLWILPKCFITEEFPPLRHFAFYVPFLPFCIVVCVGLGCPLGGSIEKDLRRVGTGGPIFSDASICALYVYPHHEATGTAASRATATAATENVHEQDGETKTCSQRFPKRKRTFEPQGNVGSPDGIAEDESILNK